MRNPVDALLGVISASLANASTLPNRLKNAPASFALQCPTFDFNGMNVEGSSSEGIAVITGLWIVGVGRFCAIRSARAQSDWIDLRERRRARPFVA